MITLRNLLPEDNRSLELVTSAILAGLVTVQTSVVLSIILALCAVLIICGVIFSSYLVRTIACLIAGALCLYLAVLSTTPAVFIIMLAISLSNFYAFIINNQGSKWI